MIINEFSDPGTKVRYIRVHTLLYVPRHVPGIVNRGRNKVGFKIDHEDPATRIRPLFTDARVKRQRQ